MPRFTINRGLDGKDFVLVRGEPIGVITRGHGPRGNTYTCTIEGERARGGAGDCVPGEQPAWAAKRARQAGLVGVRQGSLRGVPADFATAKATQAKLEADLAAAKRDLDVFPRGPMGLTPDAVKAQPGWREAKARVDRAFVALRNFNGDFVKRFAKELRAERATRRPGGLGATKPSPAERKAIEAKMKKLAARRDKLTEERRAAMWSEGYTAEVRAAFEAEDEALDDALNVLDWQLLGKKAPKEVLARVKPELLRGLGSAAKPTRSSAASRRTTSWWPTSSGSCPRSPPSARPLGSCHINGDAVDDVPSDGRPRRACSSNDKCGTLAGMPKSLEFRVIIEDGAGVRRGSMDADQFMRGTGCPRTAFLATCVDEWNKLQARRGYEDRARIEMLTESKPRRRRRR